MDIWQVLTIGVRRWRLTLPLAIVALTASWMFSGTIAPVYRAEGSLLYLPPSASVVDVASLVATNPASPGFDPTVGEVIEQRNPFAGSLRSAVLAGELYIASNDVELALHSRGLSTKYSAVSDSRNAVLYISAEASSANVAIDTVDEVISIARNDLSSRQESFGVDPIERVTAQTVTQDQLAVIDLGGRTRVRAILLLLSASLAFGAAVLLEGFIEHRSRKRSLSPLGDDEYLADGANDLQGSGHSSGAESTAVDSGTRSRLHALTVEVDPGQLTNPSRNAANEA